MGTEMIAKATHSFERRQRKCLDALEEPSLFSVPPKLSFAILAKPEEGHSFSEGERCRLSVVDDQLLVIRGVSVVGKVESPPQSILDAMRGAFPSLSGQVLSIFALTGKAEIHLEQL
jgi:hypothetical protein